MSHLTNGARRSKIVVHHRGVCGNDADAACTHCWERKNHPTCNGAYSFFYDFCVSRDGTLHTSWDDKGSSPGEKITAPCGAAVSPPCESQPFYKNSTGGAITCGNCSSAGITSVMMQRCYGGCGTCLTTFSDAQLCALAYVSSHLGVTASTANLIPHRKAEALDPCGVGNCGTTECCGYPNLVDDSDDGWTGSGYSQMETVLWMRANLENGCACNGICP